MSKTQRTMAFGRLQRRTLSLALMIALVPFGVARSVPYVVQPGDTLEAIAAKHETELQALIQANPQISDPDRIFPNEVVTVANPALGAVATSEDPAHSIRRYETLAMIAALYGTTVPALLETNPRIGDADRIDAGEVIRVPFAELSDDTELRHVGNDIRVFFKTPQEKTGASDHRRNGEGTRGEGGAYERAQEVFAPMLGGQLEVIGRMGCGRTEQTMAHLHELGVVFKYRDVDSLSPWELTALSRYDVLPILKRGGRMLGDFQYLDDVTSFVGR